MRQVSVFLGLAALLLFLLVLPKKKAPDDSVQVLMYHSVLPDGLDEYGEWEISESTFRAHLQYIKDNGFETLLPRDLLSGKPLPPQAVLIVFDDGYADNYTRALPILREFDAKASIALITDAIGRDPLFLTWDQCRALVESGLIELGSHTADLHCWPGIGRLEGEGEAACLARVEPDLRRSVETIRRETGQEVTFFAHPLGVVEEWLQPTLDGLFPVTFTSECTAFDPADFADGLHRLPRININENNLIDWVVK